MSADDLPQAISSGIMPMFGFNLTVHTLDNGKRVVEDNEQLRGLIASMGGHGHYIDVDGIAPDTTYIVCRQCGKAAEYTCTSICPACQKKMESTA